MEEHEQASEYPLYFAYLYLWTHGIESYYIDQYFKKHPFVDEEVETKKKWAAHIFHMQGTFDESRRVKVFIQRLRSKATKYVNAENKGRYALEGSILAILSGREDASPYICINKWLTYNRVIFTDLDFDVNAAGKDEKKIVDRVSKAIDDFCKSYILYCYESEHEARITTIKEQTLLIADWTLEEEDFQENDILQRVKSADAASLYTSFLWASAVAVVAGPLRDITRKHAMGYFENVSLHDKLSVSRAAELEAANERLRSELDRVNQEKKCRLEENTVLKQENIQLRKKVSDMEKEQSSGEQEKEMQTELRLIRKKGSAMAKELAQIQDEADALREKLKELEEAHPLTGGKEEDIRLVDTSKKYLFVVNDAKMRRKIQAWFPNSVISEKADLNSKNRDSYYMVIFITRSISHVEYFRFKQKCIAYNVPINYCNQLNYRLVCQSILRCMREYRLG